VGQLYVGPAEQVRKAKPRVLALPARVELSHRALSQDGGWKADLRAHIFLPATPESRVLYSSN